MSKKWKPIQEISLLNNPPFVNVKEFEDGYLIVAEREKRILFGFMTDSEYWSVINFLQNHAKRGDVARIDFLQIKDFGKVDPRVAMKWIDDNIERSVIPIPV